MTSIIDLTTLAPATLRLALASCASDPRGPMTAAQKALLWSNLGKRDWWPTWEDSPVPQATVVAWLEGLHGIVRAYVEGIMSAPETEVHRGEV